MAVYRTIKMDFWVDPFIESLPPLVKLLYFYFITSPNTDNLGVLEVSRRRISYDTGLTENDIENGIELLSSAGKLVRMDGLIWLVNFIKNQTNTSPMLIKSLNRLVINVTSKKLKNMICMRYPEVFKGVLREEYPIDTLSIPCIDPIDTVDIPFQEVEVEVKEELEQKQEQKLSASPSKKQDKKDPSLPSIETLFNEFWPNYPKKADKGAARKAFMAIFKGSENNRSKMKLLTDNMASHLHQYLEDVKESDPKYIKNPATWLRAQDFLEPPPEPENDPARPVYLPVDDGT